MYTEFKGVFLSPEMFPHPSLWGSGDPNAGD